MPVNGFLLSVGEWAALAFPNGRHDDQADVFAYAALQTSRWTAIDFDALAGALDDPALLNPPWPI